jgi:3-hydroxymyristoyl/3-hydroxydecanoyl-(acyl carrier protein) dehydratase
MTPLADDGDRMPLELEIERGDGRIKLTLVVPETLFWFRGHFPKFPILPGVVQLDWAVGYARQGFGLGTASVETMRTKFRRPVWPGARLTLVLSHIPARRSVAFEYADAAGAYSSGQLGFGAP